MDYTIIVTASASNNQHHCFVYRSVCLVLAMAEEFNVRWETCLIIF